VIDIDALNRKQAGVRERIEHMPLQLDGSGRG
jgi:hypothetical protein